MEARGGALLFSSPSTIYGGPARNEFFMKGPLFPSSLRTTEKIYCLVCPEKGKFEEWKMPFSLPPPSPPPIKTPPHTKPRISKANAFHKLALLAMLYTGEHRKI